MGIYIKSGGTLYPAATVAGPEGPEGPAGPPGSVDSVNGDPGPAVVLDAADVGAHPAGTLVSDEMLPDRIRASGIPVADLNANLDGGWHVAYNTTLNTPVANGYFNVLVIPFDTPVAYTTQMAFEVNTRQFYWRQETAQNWGAWERLDLAGLDTRYSASAHTHTDIPNGLTADALTSDTYVRANRFAVDNPADEFSGGTVIGGDTTGTAPHYGMGYLYDPDGGLVTLSGYFGIEMVQAGTRRLSIGSVVHSHVPLYAQGYLVPSTKGNWVGDFNTLVDSGLHQISDLLDVGYVNEPVGAYRWGALVVHRVSQDVTVQTYTTHDDPSTVWSRVLWYGVWSAWTQTLAAGKLNTTATTTALRRNQTDTSAYVQSLLLENNDGHPALGFHRPGVTAGGLRLNSDGAFEFVDDVGTAYRSLRVGTVTAPAFKGMVRERMKTDLGALTGTVNLDLNVASVFEGSQSGNITLTMSNVPIGASGTDSATTTTVILYGNGNGYTITPPAGTKMLGAAMPTSTSGKYIVLTFQNNGHTSWTMCSAAKEV